MFQKWWYALNQRSLAEEKSKGQKYKDTGDEETLLPLHFMVRKTPFSDCKTPFSGCKTPFSDVKNAVLLP